jgi:hypothetical protein
MSETNAIYAALPLPASRIEELLPLRREETVNEDLSLRSLSGGLADYSHISE